MAVLNDSSLRFMRLLGQQLVSGNLNEAPAVVGAVCGLQAQDAQAATLSVRVRSSGLTTNDVERARLRDRSVIRTWAMRGTLHLIATEDLSWLLALLGPVFAAADRRRRLQLSLDDATAANGVQIVREALAARGPLTRAELLEALTEHGIKAAGQGVIHLIALAALQGLLCLGPDRGNKPTYVLLADWAEDAARGSTFSRDEAREELARRYLAAFGPASPGDFAAWSGLPMVDVRAAWKRLDSRHELLELEALRSAAWMLKSRGEWLDLQHGGSPIVRLVPAFDTFWMGYRSRELMVSPANAKRINAGGGILHPALFVNGYAEGIWKIVRHKNQIEVVVTPFESLAAEIMPGLEAEAADVGRFLGFTRALRIEEP